MTPFQFFSEWTRNLTSGSMHGGSAISGADLAAVRVAAAQWIACGITVDVAIEACRESGSMVLEQWLAEAGPGDSAASRAVVSLVSAGSAAVAVEYAREAGRRSQTPTLRDELARDLILGRPRWSDLALRLVADVPARYCVLVLRVPGADTEHRTIAIHDIIDGTFGPGHDVLLAVGPSGFTVLIPHANGGDPVIELFVLRLSAALGSRLLGATADAGVAELPDAVSFADELIAIAIRLGRPAKVYRTSDLALEYQMSRPGPGLKVIGSVLDPLRGRPVLVDTITAYMKNHQRRQPTSRELFVHTNTLDLRLKKISELLGFDIGSVMGQRKLEAAILMEDMGRVPAHS